MIISLIAAVSANNVIGKNNKLLWNLPNDLKFFKNKTWAMPVVMGRKTFEALNNKALPGRLNIVITRNKNFTANNAVVVNSFADAKFVVQSNNYNELFVIGGGELYKQTINDADILYITHVHTTLEGDTYFPEIDTKKWQLEFNEEHTVDIKHAYAYAFQLWKRK
ncbi:MAG: dihydrofolate reductase [Bacteroidetes bacterium]|nr:dihydrofolate reductase [Bacteroidota bacterium]MBS1592243.1 dihydrofolate reductase [Bacteroidota bacterium]